MKYKVIGTPNMLVRERKRKPMSTEFEFKPLFRFDGNGEYVTDDEKLIAKLKNRFECTPVDEEENNADTSEKIKTYPCKKCGESFDNWGLFMSHCRQEHPKEG